VVALLAKGERLYLAMAEKGLYAYDIASATVRRYGGGDGLPSDDVRSIALFDGKVYAGASEGIGIQDGERWSQVTETKEFRFRSVVVAASPDGVELWACARYLAGGTFRFDGKEWRFMGGQGMGLFNDVSSFAFFPGGVLLGSSSGAVYEMKGKEVTVLSRGFPAAGVNAVGERGGTYYVGTNRGLYVWRGTGWGNTQVPEPFSRSAVFSVLRVESDLFVGGMSGLLLLDRKGAARFLSGKDGFPEGPVTALAASGKTLYAATDKGVLAVEGWNE